MDDGSPIHRDEAFRGWRPISQGAVRSSGVVLDAPLFDEDLGLVERVEDLTVKQFVAQFLVEAPALSVFPRIARLDVRGPGA